MPMRSEGDGARPTLADLMIEAVLFSAARSTPAIGTCVDHYPFAADEDDLVKSSTTL